MVPASMGAGAQWGNAGPVNLPNDMTRSQFLMLTKYQQGFGKPKEVAKTLSMGRTRLRRRRML